jgi:serine/threonine protein kinase
VIQSEDPTSNIIIMGCNTSRPEAVRQWAHNDGVSPTLLGKNTEARRQQQRNPVMEQAVVPNSSSRDLLELKSLHDAYVERGDMNGCMVRMEGGDGRPIEDVYEGVRDGKELGRGAFGVVRLATHRATGVQYAVKCIQHTQLPTKESINLLKKEIQVMCEVSETIYAL